MYWLLLTITTVLLALYGALILQYRKWLLRLPEFVPDVSAPVTRFSVIIPARNEEDNIGECLRSVLTQDYPAELFEVIVVDDHSTDNTAGIVNEWKACYNNLRLINLAEHLDAGSANSYKKKSIETAASQSSGEWIVTTDADCIVKEKWLSLYDAFIQKNKPVFIAAPVMFSNNGSFLSVFQLLDFISLQAITAASVSAGYHSMCNGANIAYRKDVFEEVGRFAGIDHIASGDDMLLMYKIKKKHPEAIGYLFSGNAIVTTAPMLRWKDFLNQRIRWASKADQYQDQKIFWVLLLVYLVNAGFFLLLLLSLSGNGGNREVLILLIVKTIIELPFMIPAAGFFGQSQALWWFPVMQPFHIAYTVIAGWLGKFGTYQWKGRKVR